MKSSREMASGVLSGANHQITKVKGNDHGDLENSFEMIADFWSTWLTNRNRNNDLLGDGVVLVTAYDVAEMMSLLKKARKVHGNTGIEDHFIDDVGYSALAFPLAPVGSITTPPAHLTPANSTPEGLEDRAVKAAERTVSEIVNQRAMESEKERLREINKENERLAAQEKIMQMGDNTPPPVVPSVKSLLGLMGSN